MIRNFLKGFCWTVVHFVGPLVPSVSDDSAHEFQSQGGSIVACALLWIACKDPQSHLWLQFMVEI